VAVVLLIELWFLFVWLGTLCEKRCERVVSVRGEGGGPFTVVARESCDWGSSVRDMLSCAVRFLGRALDSVHWGVISSKNEGVGTTLGAT
jgi:hypothetical protein